MILYRSSPKRIEDAIQRALVADMPSGVHVIATRNEDSRHHLAQGVDVGCPDLILLHRSGTILFVLFLELKTKNGKLRGSQKKWRDERYEAIKAENTQYAIAYGYDEARSVICDWLESIRKST